MQTADALTNAMDALLDHLRFLQEEGVTEVAWTGGKKGEAPRGAASKASSRPPQPAPAPPQRAAVPATPKPPAAAPAPSVSPPDDETVRGLRDIAARIAACQQCVLHRTRTRTVPGQGHPHPEILFVGEAPGADEDEQGLAFVGRAGQRLTQMITAMGLRRDEVFIGNICKCRPPENRKPTPAEMAACLPYLKEQIALLKPKVIVALGATAVEGLTHQLSVGITRLRGRWLQFGETPMMPTFHPSYLLRNPKATHEVWADMLEVLKALGRTPPVRKKAD